MKDDYILRPGENKETPKEEFTMAIVALSPLIIAVIVWFIFLIKDVIK